VQNNSKKCGQALANPKSEEERIIEEVPYRWEEIRSKGKMIQWCAIVLSVP
jgi:hypothetical protein